MLELAHGVNAIPLSMSLTWPMADQKKSCASTGMGIFHAQSYTHKQLTSAHQANNGLPHRIITWAHMISVSGIAASPMLELAHGVNAIPLSMSSTWPTADQKKSCASTGMGPFHAQSYTHKQLASAHQAHNGLPHRIITWAHMILVSRTAPGPYARIGPS